MTNKEHTITEVKEWPKGQEVSYHDWVIRASKEEIAKKLGFKPKYNRSGDKCTYLWKCNLDNGKFFFTIYDMSYGRHLGPNEVTEYHIGFDAKYNEIREFFPNTIEACDMLIALTDIGLQPDHSETWKRFHEDGVFEDIQRIIKEKVKSDPICI